MVVSVKLGGSTADDDANSELLATLQDHLLKDMRDLPQLNPLSESLARDETKVVFLNKLRNIKNRKSESEYVFLPVFHLRLIILFLFLQAKA